MPRHRISWLSLAAFPLLALFVGCKSDTWRGYVYPDRTDLSVDHFIGDFSTLRDCRQAARAYLAGARAEGFGDYECGLNCEYTFTGGGLNVCEETSR